MCHETRKLNISIGRSPECYVKGFQSQIHKVARLTWGKIDLWLSEKRKFRERKGVCEIIDKASSGAHPRRPHYIYGVIKNKEPYCTFMLAQFRARLCHRPWFLAVTHVSPASSRVSFAAEIICVWAAWDSKARVNDGYCNMMAAAGEMLMFAYPSANRRDWDSGCVDFFSRKWSLTAGYACTTNRMCRWPPIYIIVLTLCKSHFT
jgi:hypothetical protein